MLRPGLRADPGLAVECLRNKRLFTTEDTEDAEDFEKRL
jgi:hypothetical protein